MSLKCCKYGKFWLTKEGNDIFHIHSKLQDHTSIYDFFFFLKMEILNPSFNLHAFSMERWLPPPPYPVTMTAYPSPGDGYDHTVCLFVRLFVCCFFVCWGVCLFCFVKWWGNDNLDSLPGEFRRFSAASWKLVESSRTRVKGHWTSITSIILHLIL